MPAAACAELTTPASLPRVSTSPDLDMWWCALYAKRAKVEPPPNAAPSRLARCKQRLGNRLCVCGFSWWLINIEYLFIVFCVDNCIFLRFTFYCDAFDKTMLVTDYAFHFGQSWTFWINWIVWEIKFIFIFIQTIVRYATTNLDANKPYLLSSFYQTLPIGTLTSFMP